MWFYQNWSTEAFIYLSIHGTYSILWLVKESTFPDRRFDQRLPIWAGTLFVFLPLAGYYIAPYLLISRHVKLAPWFIAVVLSIYTIGIFLHYVSDAQKYYTLKLQKGLITEGLFRRTRNPNYLGEILIYASYAHDVPPLASVPDPGRMGFWIFLQKHAQEGQVHVKVSTVRGICSKNGSAVSKNIIRHSPSSHLRNKRKSNRRLSLLKLICRRQKQKNQPNQLKH